MKLTKVITRREFVNKTSQASFAVAMGLPLIQTKKVKKNKSRVILIRDQNAVDSDRNVSNQIIVNMFDRAMAVLFDKENAAESWQQIIHPNDIVGIKTNTWSLLHTPQSLEKVIVEHCVRAGVDQNNVSVDDRGVRRNPVFQKATALINIRPMRTHHWAGVGGCLKNPIMFTDSPPQYHPDSCASLGALWQLPSIKGKVRLNVLVLLTPLFHGIGPHHFDIKYTWPYNGILVSQDPVAVDAVGLKIIETYRLHYFANYKPLWPPAKHIALADTKYGIGNADFANIELIKLGWEEGVLI